MSINARHWSEVSNAVLTLEAIRELHVPASHYRISPNRYNAGVASVARSRAGRIYVLSGAYSMKFGPRTVELEAGMFADFPEGEHEFKVLGEQPVQFVEVWLLPEQYRRKD